MDGGSSEGSEARFAGYAEALGVVLGHADRQQPMQDYCLGLLMPIERKSVEPMAAVTAPAQVAAKHQSLLHFIGNAPWSDAAMLASLIETCTLLGVNPEAYLTDVLTKLVNNWPNSRIAELTPWRWSTAH